jgi:subtilisin-like proprotein convertase family protein
MKNLFLASLMTLLIFEVSANATVTLSGSGSGGTVSDNNPNGFISQITFAQNITIENVVVHLTFSGGYNGDLYAYLVHDGATAILLNRIGTAGAGTFGNSGAGMNVYLNDSVAASDIHTAGTLISAGTYGSDGRYADPSDLNAVQSAGRTRLLTSFNGGQSYGTWTLFVADVDSGAQSTLTGWDMEITGVPEPINCALLMFGGIFVCVQGRRWLKNKRLQN